jgi:nitroreductase
MLRDLILKNRSYRRFHQEIAVQKETLRELVDLARLSSSGRNLQPLKYVLVCDADKNAEVFPLLGWAGYLKDWGGPQPGERPAAYIVILYDKDLTQAAGVDHGIAAQSILLGAVEKGLGGCIIATINRPKLAEVLNLPPRYDILLVLALGQPKETVVIDPVGPEGDIKYWRDANQTHHVPKRALDDIILA